MNGNLCMLTWLVLQNGFVFCEICISIVAPSTFRYKLDKLVLGCQLHNMVKTDSILSLIIQKYLQSEWSDLVRIDEGDLKWVDTNLEARANVVNSSVQYPIVTLQIEIDAESVTCSDGGKYRCKIMGTSSNGGTFTDLSTEGHVFMNVAPSEIGEIIVNPPQTSNTYNPESVLTLMCTGDVGNPPDTLRWCFKRKGFDLGYIGYPYFNAITELAPTMLDCQYRRTSVLTYEVPDYYEQVDFRCETGGISMQCGHVSSIASSITIYKCQDSCPSYIQIDSPSNLRYNLDGLAISCDPVNVTENDSISSITLQKYSTTEWRNVVKGKGSTSSSEMIWMDEDMAERAIVSFSLFPATSARLQFNLTANNLTCSDDGSYRCVINGIAANGLSLNSVSTPRKMKITANSRAIEPISVNQSNTDNIYRPNTTITLTCTGEVGNPSGKLNWFIKREGIDSNFTDFPFENDITYGNSSMNGCRYRQTSVLRYNVSSELHSVDFKCRAECLTDTSMCTAVAEAIITIRTNTSFTTSDGWSLSIGNLSLLGHLLLSFLLNYFIFRKFN